MPAIITKQPGEKLDRAVDFADALGSATLANIDAVTAIKTSDASPAPEVIAANPAPFVPAGTQKVQFRVIDGADGEQYKLTVKVTASDGQKLEFDLFLNVQEV